MTVPKAEWRQKGPIGDTDWFVDVYPGSVVVVIEGEDSEVKQGHQQHLRDFAKALDRAAASLDAATGDDDK